MKNRLQNLSGKLTAGAILLIMAYIGYNEFFRGSRLGDDLNQAIKESKRVQQDMHVVVSHLQEQREDLNATLKRLDQLSGTLTGLDTTVKDIAKKYYDVSTRLNQQVAVSLDRYQQQKKYIQDIQKQIK